MSSSKNTQLTAMLVNTQLVVTRMHSIAFCKLPALVQAQTEKVWSKHAKR